MAGVPQTECGYRGGRGIAWQLVGICAMKYLALLFVSSAVLAQVPQPGIPSLSEPVPEFAQANQVALSPTTHDDQAALSIRFGTDTPWPNLAFVADSSWSWLDYAGIRIGLHNPGDTPVTLSLRVDNAGANGSEHCNTKSKLIAPGEDADLTLYFNTADRERFWGMRGIPVRGPMGTGAPLDLTRITGWQLFLNRPTDAKTILLTSAALFGQGGNLADKVPFPFIDAYGQYKHLEWPEKIHSDVELRQAHETELTERGVTRQRNLDHFGGWADGPRLDATGWFRTAQHEGKWWLVTPEGHLFFSAGADCVGTWSRTFVTGRDDWFEWLPAQDDPLFQGAYGYGKNAHSMAERIGGEGKTFGFYASNLIRTHGEGWASKWRVNTAARLHAWGFNTIGNWSDWTVMEESDLPFVVHLGISGVRPIAAATGYWSKMMDVYDPSFQEAVNRAADKGTLRWRNNTRCIGYFVDNELAWEGVIQGVLHSKPEQPARQAFLSFLKDRHNDLDTLNTAWKTQFPTWQRIADPGHRTPSAESDLEAYLESFAATYYRTIAEALNTHAPMQLYLGCRFANAPAAVVRACARFADVVSFNIYARELSRHNAALFDTLGKPVLIGEFHFGATDRGMFHTGLVPVATQQDRGKAYAHYVESMLRHPAVVGCHWFQYVDEPTTGRNYDGENYNIGLVDITDQPYPDLVGAASEIHRRMYTLRHSTNRAGSR
jgi:hypothetical protein